MGTNTPHYNLYKPDEGETGWASAVNANWDTIDANLTNSLPRAYLAGCQLSNNSGTPNTKLDISAGQAQDVGNAGAMTLSASLTKDLTATWSVGSGGGGLGNGVTRASGTWYHVFLIKRTDTSVVDAYFDTSAVAANIPSPYTLFRRLGSFATDGSSNILTFVQDGDYFRYKASQLSVNTTNPGTSAVLATLSVPTGVNVRAICNLYFQSTTDATSEFITISDPAANDEAASQTNTPLAVGSGSNTYNTNGRFEERTNTSAQIRYRCNGSDGSTIVRIATLGWWDRRGRDA